MDIGSAAFFISTGAVICTFIICWHRENMATWAREERKEQRGKTDEPGHCG